MKKYFAIWIMALALVAGCKKESDSTRTEIQTYPFRGYIEERNLLPIELMVTSPQRMEIGYHFNVTRNQSVVKLGALMPNAGTYTVTLWDASTEEILARTSVTVEAKQFGYAPISSVKVEPRRDYIVSINTSNENAPSNYFAHQIASAPFPLYPVQFGILTVNGIVFRVSDTPTFPYTVIEDYQYYLMGIPDLELQ